MRSRPATSAHCSCSAATLTTCLPDTERVRRALSNVEVLVVADVVHTEITDLATHLASCAGQLERADVTLGVDQYLPAVAAQYTPAVLRPAKQRRELWFILAKLREHLGHQAIPDGRPADDCTAEDLIAVALQSSPADLEHLMNARTAVVAHEAVYGWVRRNVEKRDGWRLAPAEFVALLPKAVGPGRSVPDPSPPTEACQFSARRHGGSSVGAGRSPCTRKSCRRFGCGGRWGRPSSGVERLRIDDGRRSSRSGYSARRGITAPRLCGLQRQLADDVGGPRRYVDWHAYLLWRAGHLDQRLEFRCFGGASGPDRGGRCRADSPSARLYRRSTRS